MHDSCYIINDSSLIPRPFKKRLHGDEAKNASKIDNQLQLHFDPADHNRHAHFMFHDRKFIVGGLWPKQTINFLLRKTSTVICLLLKIIR